MIMKKYVSTLLALALLMSLFAGCGGKQDPSPSQPAAPAVANSLEVLQTIWGLYGEEELFSVFGGNVKENGDVTMDAPDNYDLADPNISFNLLIPADQVANVDDVASMTHAMMANNFNSAVFHVKEDPKAFAETMYQAVSGNMWICGMPESTIIAIVGGDYVVMAYGVGQAMDSFEAHLAEAYPSAEILYNEPIV